MIISISWIFAIIIFLKNCIPATSYKNLTNYTSIVNLNSKSINDSRHAFFRSMDGGAAGGAAGSAAGGGPGSRRVFGGAAAPLSECPAVCALLDRYWAVRCSATVLNAHWALTAAHCITPKVTYVKYNTRRPASTDGNVTAVYFLYQHPKYEVEQKDEGRGPDVTLLHHDVGLVRTRDAMKLASTPSAFLDKLPLINPQDLLNQEVQVYGFGRTERSVLGEELFAVRLRLAGCERGGWLHCVCGVAEQPRGVCSGDSGGPVLYGGSPIAVTSMGPVECAGGARSPPAGATSVFTALQRYADVINATIHDTEAALRMRIIARAPAPLAGGGALCALCSILSLLHWDFTSIF